MAQAFYADSDDHAYRDDMNPVRADLYGEMAYEVPLNRDNALFCPATGLGVPNSSVSFGEWADQESYQYGPPIVRYCPPYQQPGALGGTLTPPKELNQLVPEDLRILNQIWSERPPTAMFSEPSNTPMSTSFGSPISSPEMYNYPFNSQFNAGYINGDIVFPCLETTTSIVIPVPRAFVPSSSSISPTAQLHAPPMPGNSEVEQAVLNAESESATDSLPLRKLDYGVWKCMLCGQELRRKQRAIVHYWSKHSDVRLDCSGRCGSIDCNKSFASQGAINVHLNPVLIDCSLCILRSFRSSWFLLEALNISNLTKTAPFRRGCASPAVALESMSMGTYYGLWLLWIFVPLVQAETLPSTVAVPPLQWIRLKPNGTNVAPALAYSAAGFDYINKLLVLFGGETSGGLFDSNTHLLDMTTMTWSNPNPTINENVKPPGRSRALYGHDSMASYRNGFVIYGGQGQQGALSDVWEYVFNGQFWYNVTNIVGDIPSARFSATGGGDPPSVINADPNLLTTFWLTGGVETGSDGSPQAVSYDYIYRLQMSGTIAGNFQNPNATWTKLPSVSSGNANPRIGQGGLVMRTLEGEGKLGLYGGCVSTAQSSVSCAQQDAHVISTASGGQWDDIAACPSARIGATFVPNLNHLFSDMGFLLFGLSPSTNSTNIYELGTRGEIDVLSISQGTWSRVLPSCDPTSTPPCPIPREGAAVVSSEHTMAGSSAVSSASDIVIFGGKDKDGNVLNDVWILRATTAQTNQTNQTNWSAQYGNGVLEGGVEANGQGVTVEFLNECAQAASSSGSPPPSDQSPNTGGTSAQPNITAYSIDTRHKVLAASSVIVILAAVASSRSVPSSSSTRLDITFHQLPTILVVLAGGIAWTLGIAGFATSFTSVTVNPDAAESIKRRDVTGKLVFVQTDHAIAGTILFALAYVIAPLLIFGCRWMKRQKTSRKPDSATSHADGKGAIPRRSYGSVPPSEYPSRPTNERSGTSHQTQPSLLISTGPATPEDDADTMGHDGEDMEDEPIGAGKRVRLTHRRLSAPAAFFKEQLWPGKSWVNPSEKRERVSSHPSPPSQAAPISSSTSHDTSLEGGGGFVILNRGKNALDRRTPPPLAYDQSHQRRAPTTLGEVSWLERRRNVHMINDLDYAMSQQHSQPSHHHHSPLITPSTQYSKPLLSSDPDGGVEPDRRRLSSHGPAEFPPLSTVVLHSLFHLLLLALCVFTAASIFLRGNGALATPLGAVFVALVFSFYVFIIILAMRGKPDGSTIAVIVSRLRANKDATRHGAEDGMDAHSDTPETKHIRGHQSLVLDTTTVNSLRASRAFIEQSRYSGEINDARGQDPRIEDDEDDAEDIEREMGRRDVSIVTVPKRRLFIANSDMP